MVYLVEFEELLRGVRKLAEGERRVQVDLPTQRGNHLLAVVPDQKHIGKLCYLYKMVIQNRVKKVEKVEDIRQFGLCKEFAYIESSFKFEIYCQIWTDFLPA